MQIQQISFAKNTRNEPWRANMIREEHCVIRRVIYKLISRNWTRHDWFVLYTKFQEIGRTFNFQNKFLSRGAKVLKITYLPHTIEFRMIDLFPKPNFEKIEECLFLRTYFGLKEQRYQNLQICSCYWYQHDQFVSYANFKEIEKHLIFVTNSLQKQGFWRMTFKFFGKLHLVCCIFFWSVL